MFHTQCFNKTTHEETFGVGLPDTVWTVRQRIMENISPQQALGFTMTVEQEKEEKKRKR